MHYKLTDKINLFANATYSHFSNGDTKNPNYGLNFPNFGAGLDYRLSTKEKPMGKLYFYKERWRYDFSLFGSNKSHTQFKFDRFWVYGADITASYRSGRIHAFSAGVEAFQDLSNKRYLDSRFFYKNYDSRMVGVLAGHEFVLNRFIFSQQLGFYLFKDNPEFSRIYQRWGISYKLNREFRLGLNLNASLQKAYIFDLRLSYSLYH